MESYQECEYCNFRGMVTIFANGSYPDSAAWWFCPFCEIEVEEELQYFMSNI